MNYRSLVPYIIRRFIKKKAGIPDTWNTLIKLKKEHNFYPKIIFDVGAYKGEWTKMCSKIFPNCQYFLFEPQKELNLLLENPLPKNITYENILLGKKDNKKVNFYENETSSSVLKFGNHNNPTFKKTMSLDTFVKNQNIPDIDILKIDVQGYELEVLKGSLLSLETIQFLIVEVSFLEIYDNAPLANEIIQFLNTQNFQIFDIVDFKLRPLDRILFQVDMFFIKKDSIIIENKKYY
ncbi:MAG: hypothetical protein CMG62_11040 [Candidatus Marinimicrobia bacterium]|nr:hypothetical protein [Candidatus Neomarinimicrobiota bacterium]|tara:strand:+ start:3879 stop:4586 length:708 start_codon:yes stop_codon:yes gene_type:complete